MATTKLADKLTFARGKDTPKKLRFDAPSDAPNGMSGSIYIPKDSVPSNITGLTVTIEHGA